MPPDPRQAEDRESLPDVQLQELARALAEGRAAQGLSLEELARKLHMGIEQLRALEQADGAKLPELVFVIAHARRIASVLELSIDPLIDALRQDSASSTRFAGITSRAKAAAKAAPQTRSRPVAIREGAHDVPASLSRSQKPPARPERAGSASTGPNPGPAVSVNPSPSGSAAWLRPLAALALVAGVASAGTALWRHGFPSSGSTPVRPVPAVQPAAPRPAIASADLVLRSRQPSWLEVRTRKGQRLHFGILRGQLSFPNRAGLEVRAGRPDLIIVTTAPGTSRVLGRIDQLRWWLIQPDGRILPLPGKPA
ncbi:MAG: helix-turn-helix domain-containing protein [Cyanobacteriota bacterium]